MHYFRLLICRDAVSSDEETASLQTKGMVPKEAAMKKQDSFQSLNGTRAVPLALTDGVCPSEKCAGLSHCAPIARERHTWEDSGHTSLE